MDKTQPQAPEPLNLTTALASMKAINMIFQNQRGSLYYFEPLRISSPFSFIDFESFKDDVRTRTGTKDIPIRNDIKAIEELAALNIQLFDKIKARKFEGVQDKHYTINKEGRALPVFTTDDSIVPNDDYPQVFQYPLINLQLFCKRVHEFTIECLENPMEAKPKQPTKAIRTKKDNDPTKSFIDYLDTDNNTESLEYLKAQFSGHKGKTIAYMIFALKSIHVLKDHDLMSLFKAITADFGNIGTYESVRDNKKPSDKNSKQYQKYNDIQLRVIKNIHQPIL